MNTIVVDIADMAMSDDPESELVTYSLGSCLGVTVYDPVAHIGGMIHCMLPLSSVDGQKAVEKPFMFVDTGIVLFLQTLFNAGVQKSRAIVKMAGCASVLDHQGMFRIGERNLTTFRKIIWKNGMIIAAQDVGGEKARTIRLNIGSGRFTISSCRETTEI